MTPLIILQRGATRYECVGRAGNVLTWQTTCATCGVTFEFTTGARSVRPFELPRRCKPHRQPGVPVEERRPSMPRPSPSPGGTPAALHADDVGALLELERDR